MSNFCKKTHRLQDAPKTLKHFKNTFLIKWNVTYKMLLYSNSLLNNVAECGVVHCVYVEVYSLAQMIRIALHKNGNFMFYFLFI